ncbi:MAG: hypothetical protein AAGG51_17155 [Cyanobacteria bacterium P01_G01_bin.54]
MRDVLLVIVLVGILYAAWSLWQENQGRTAGIHPDLIKAARGDRHLAQRTLAHLRQKYPEKSEQWCREKAIYDLYRDHGSTGGAARSRSFNSMSKREVRENLWIAGLALWVAHSFMSLIDRIRH